MFIIGVSVFLSLISFNKTDNNFFSYNSSLTENKNLLGFVGSFVSSFLKDIFGNISFLIPLFFIFHSIRSIFGKNLFWYNWSLLPILLIFACILVELVSSNYFQNFFSGGILGIGLSNYLLLFVGDFWNPHVTLLIILLTTLVIFFLSLNLKTLDSILFIKKYIN